MRILLVGAFPYPHYYGSQIYFQEQAIALRSAGADVSLLTYSSELPDPSSPDPGRRRFRGRDATEHWRALDGFEHRTSPGWTSPTSLRSGPNWAKLLADLGLAMTLRNAIASCQSDDAYDAILTHNAEAALIALHALPKTRPPVLYCVHTLLGNELSAYLRGPNSLKRQCFLNSIHAPGPTGTVARNLDRVGDRIDRWIAKRVDGWLCLTQHSERVMRQFSRAPGKLAPPPIPDPQRTAESLSPIEVARRYSLEPGRYFLYSGNLDGYQELGILAAAAVELAGRSDSPPQIVIASHPDGDHAFDGAAGISGRRNPERDSGREDPPGGYRAGWIESMPGVEFRAVESAAEMQALLAAARSSLVMRRAKGGFPIKLANSLSVGTPIIAFHEQEWGLTHEQDSLICPPSRPALALADAIERLANDDALAKRLAKGARALYLERHRPEHVAADTLALVEKVQSSRAR
jgi:glycosyltransferase involved in cell wall biosynthesis